MTQPTHLSKSILRVALVAITLLMIPFIAMQFNEEVKWDPLDFVLMGTIIFTTGLAYVLITRHIQVTAHRLATAMGLGTLLFMIWSNLAVGLIGSGPHFGNLLYIAVVLVGGLGFVRAKSSAVAMESTMYAMALTIVAIAVIALLSGMQHRADSSVMDIIAVNGFFAFLFVVAGFMFRYTQMKIRQDK